MRYVLVDCMNLFMRCRMSTPGTPLDKAGLALSVTLQSVAAAYNKFQADYVVFCFDSTSWRKAVYAPYKANRAVKRLESSEREKEEAAFFFDVINDFENHITHFTNCIVLKEHGLEADDLIARWIQLYSKNTDNEFIIVSTDSDFVQLLNPQVKIYNGVEKRIITHNGVFDEKMQSAVDKKKNLIPNINPEFALFEKCIRGDSGDNVSSAYPGVRSKGTSKKVGIEEAFADRHNQGFTWFQFFKSTWEDNDGKQHIVEDVYKRNQMLIDLSQQPEEIKELLDSTIFNLEPKTLDNKLIAMNFMKFLAKHELNRIAEKPEKIVEIFTKKFDSNLIKEIMNESNSQEAN